MARKPRIDIGGEYYHVLNRANARLQVFFLEEEYVLFEHVLLEAKHKFDMRILAYCLMPNHYHLILYPRADKDLQKFMQWVTLTHTQRWHKVHHTTGSGHLYQGRYKSIHIQDDRHLLAEMIYIERNPVRAKIVRRAIDWKFSSARHRKGKKNRLITEPPIELPKDYALFADGAIF
jgi:putative transposase